jgi:hypothetical protein
MTSYGTCCFRILCLLPVLCLDFPSFLPCLFFSTPEIHARLLLFIHPVIYSAFIESILFALCKMPGRQSMHPILEELIQGKELRKQVITPSAPIFFYLLLSPPSLSLHLCYILKPRTLSLANSLGSI